MTDIASCKRIMFQTVLIKESIIDAKASTKVELDRAFDALHFGLNLIDTANNN